MDYQVRGNGAEAVIKEQSGHHNEGRLVDDMIEVKAVLLDWPSIGTKSGKERWLGNDD
jgi:hypothetical protein